MKNIAKWSIVLVLVMTTSISAVAGEIEDLEQRKNSIESQKVDITKQKQAEQNKEVTVQKEVVNLANTQAKVEKDLQLTADQIKIVNEHIKQAEAALKEAEDKYNKQQELFKARVRIMYENSKGSPLKSLLESRSISDFLAKRELMSVISKRDNELAEEMEKSRQDIEQKKKLKEDEKGEKEKQAADQKKTITSLQVSRSQKDQEISRINSTLSNLEKQENELNQKSEEIANWIKTLKSKRKGGYAGGNMTWPTPSASNVTSPFGNRLHPVLRQYRMHTGIDIGAGSGAAIVAANNGTVIYSGWQDGYGNTVIIDHGGDIVTLYAHCSKLLVSSGAEVNAGDTIAKVGTTGISTGPHLHFEVRKDGEPVDPLAYVSP